MPNSVFVQADVEKLDLGVTPLFELIIAGELIEHLNNPGLFLERAKFHLVENGRILITTPNITSFKVFMDGFRGRQHIHPDHSLGLTFSLLETLFDRHDLVIEDWYCSFETTGSRWNKRLNRLLSVFVERFPHIADTLAVVVRRKNEK